MGVKDFIQKQAENYFEKKELAAQRQKEYNEQSHILLNFTSNTQKIHCGPSCMMHQKPDGTVLFGYNTVDTYRLISYEWTGPQYDIITNSNTTGTEIKKGKAGKIGAGAVIGSVVPGIGTAVGAAMGAGSKGQKDIRSNTTSVSQQREIPTPATLKLKNNQTGEIFGVTFNCTTFLDAKIKAFNFDGEAAFVPEPAQNLIAETETTTSQQAPLDSDPYEELKKLKELLDIGVISVDDFDAKKKQLLNI